MKSGIREKSNGEVNQSSTSGGYHAWEGRGAENKNRLWLCRGERTFSTMDAKIPFSVPEALGHKRVVCHTAHPRPQEVLLCFTPSSPVPTNGRVIGRSRLSHAIFQKRSEFFSQNDDQDWLRLPGISMILGSWPLWKLKTLLISSMKIFFATVPGTHSETLPYTKILK